uniref:Glutathione S-transferase alpha 4 n=1 Tax=Myotis myotis TaxID=51298 RepID=A0A7J7WVE2_MYOMY|nr:glutathione S-transferase alpha 4 [Myotis myotis]
MAEKKPKLHYPNGRGRMETVRWVLAAAGVETPTEGHCGHISVVCHQGA